MESDRYPVAQLVRRLYDIGLFIVAAGCLASGLLIGVLVRPDGSHVVVGLGMAGSFIAAYLEFRQRTVYERDYGEPSILAGELRVEYLQQIGRVRRKLMSANMLAVLFGLWVSAYGSAW